MFTALVPLLVAAIAFLSHASAEITIDTSEIVVLASYGSGDTTFSALTSDSTPPTIGPSSLFSASVINSEPAGRGMTNHTIQLSSSGSVGSDDIVLTSGESSATSTVIVAGVVILDNGVIISGEDGAGATVGQTGSKSYEYKAVNTDGSSFTISSASIGSSSPYKELDTSATSFSGSNFVIVLNDYRVGTGTFTIDITVAAITYAGEVLETVLKVSQSTSSPPCVAIGGEYPISDGKVAIKMFNLLAPPQSSAIGTVEITIGGLTTPWDPNASTLGISDQSVVFPVSVGGDASITCDGEDAIIQDGPITVTGGGDVALASSAITDLKPVNGYSEFTVNVIDVESSPDILTLAQLKKIIAAVCPKMKPLDGQCVLSSLVKGSAIMGLSGLVKPDDSDAAKERISNCFGTCECQRDSGYSCDKLMVGEITVNAIPGITADVGSPLSTWMIVVIAGLGAFALIALIMLGLLAVYRRSAEQSESDYSSSGPLGVPDPSDLLYEQSIVRDIYGRGDYPDGGPTKLAAEERLREANLREEFLRPPSSNSLSRDDASSTYTL